MTLIALKDAELTLARQLIEQGSVDQFKPENYRDTVRDRVLEAIQQKVDGQEITSEPAAPQTKIIDLMDALKASLAKRADSTAERKSPVKVAAAKSDETAAAKPKKKASGAR